MPVLIALLLFFSFARTSASQDITERLRLLVERAQAADAQDRTEESVALYREILQLRPHWASAELNLGLVYHSRKQYNDAIALLTEALEHDAALHSALLFRGASYHHIGRNDLAAKDLQSYLRIDPNSAEALSYLGSTYSDGGDYLQAAAAYAKLAKIDGTPSTWFQLSDSYLQYARFAMKRLADDKEAKTFFLLLSAEELVRPEQREVAERQAREALARSPQSVEARSVWNRISGKSQGPEPCTISGAPAISRANCAAERGELEAATRALLAVNNSGVPSPRTMYWSFRISKRLSQAAIAKLAEVAPDSASLALMRAEIADQNGDAATAESEYQRALTSGSSDVETLVRFAKFLCRRERFDAAVPLFEQALSIDPGNPQVAALLGEVHLAQGRPEKALAYFEPILRTRPDETQTRLYVARSLLELQRTPEAIQVLEASPADPDGRIHYLLAITYQKIGQPAKAREAMNLFRARRDAHKP